MKKNKYKVNIKKMGINIDKNEFYEIVCSNSNHPEDFNTRKYIKKKTFKGLSQ